MLLNTRQLKKMMQINTSVHKHVSTLQCLYQTEVESSRTSLASRTSSRTHFEVLGLGLETSSPWPRSLKSSKIALSSARGQHYFFEQLKFCWKTPKIWRKICEQLFCFPHLEHRRRQGEGARVPPN